MRQESAVSQFKVVVTDFIHPPLEHENRILGDISTVTALNAFSEAELDGKLVDADAIMIYHFISLTKQTLRQLKKCKLIVRCGVGFDNVDWRLARELGIDVANVPDYGTEEVADSAIGMALTLARGIHFMNSRLQRSEGDWVYEQVKPTHRLRNRVFGIVGLGRIGTATALRAKALGMDVRFFDPYAPDGRDKALGVRRCETLHELLSTSDIVSVHCPNSPETHHLINEETLAQMKPDSFLVNTARGAVVDVAAVFNAVERNQLRGAAIDVLETEPPIENDPLIKAWRDPSHPAYDRIIINPHAAFYSEQGLDDMRIKGSENCRRVLSGEPARNVINS